MQYKYSFMQYEGVPKEYIERDKQRQMQEGIHDIGKKILEHYEYEEESHGFSAQSTYTIELVVTSAEKYYQACKSIGQMVSAHSPELARQVQQILEDMQRPDIEPLERTK